MAMSIASHPTTEQLIAELYKVEGKAEIVNGEIVLMSPTGRRPGRAGYRICRSLEEAEARLGGYAYPDNVAFLVDLPNRKSFAPDAAFSKEPPTMEFGANAPIFAVEVRSEGDYGPAAERDMAEKRADYFAAGTQVVWDVDLLGEDVIRKYTVVSQTVPMAFRQGEIADAEPGLPGWKFAVDELFDK
jgi:Uma2 family endonuclease